MSSELSLPTECDLPATPEIRHDLHKIEYLLVALSNASPYDDADRDDILWLHDHRRFLRSVIAARHRWQQQRVVSLAHWRCGATSALQLLARIA